MSVILSGDHFIDKYRNFHINRYHINRIFLNRPQSFFIDHTAKTTTFIDPRLPLEWPLLLLAVVVPADMPQTPPVYAGYAGDAALLTPTSSQVMNDTVNNG